VFNEDHKQNFDPKNFLYTLKLHYDVIDVIIPNYD